MAYTVNIPQANDIISQSQPQLLANFQEINTLIEVNHATFGTPNEGKHNIVTLPVNAAPTPTLINEGSIYSKTSTFTGNTELAWQRQNNGTVIEWTGLLAANAGWTRLPSGILLKWAFPAITGLNQPIVFPTSVNIPVFTNIFQVFTTCQVISGARITSNVIGGTVTTLGFNVDVINTNTGAGLTATVSYLAIGI
ncbi:hypothetical protein UFOVP97_40 [uncultured Caudovirales phage]|uniref:Uncharacterized protein n=1 Tax=uncultured Caudovirales phage TaxID=2100421 RepID=A0A6J5L5D2_9CAUD|nr:hypothetical protein UFOVP97_40 [uncultured Caudovirales phage]CAB4133992.1 hypothetical protein UFOVP268_2 [uncultured Caudovirales phage]